jgi:hypothetical protein
MLVGLLWHAVKDFLRSPPPPEGIPPDPPLPPDAPMGSKSLSAGFYPAHIRFRGGGKATVKLLDQPRRVKPAPEDKLPTVSLKDLTAQATIVITFRDDLAPINAGYPMVAPTFAVPPSHLQPWLN